GQVDCAGFCLPTNTNASCGSSCETLSICGVGTCVGGVCDCLNGEICLPGFDCDAAGQGCVCGGMECDADDICCNDQCVSAIPDDPINCGCEGQCAANDTCCGYSCANLATDPRNCGACGNDCGPGENCNQGVCSTSMMVP